MDEFCFITAIHTIEGFRAIAQIIALKPSVASRLRQKNLSLAGDLFGFCCIRHFLFYLSRPHN